eukprot:SAG25_NODE_10223_length_342_cov_0.683128_1_plen_40_part_10
MKRYYMYVRYGCFDIERGTLSPQERLQLERLGHDPQQKSG